MIEPKIASGERLKLIEQISGIVMRWQDATQRFDETVGEIWLSAAERLCLSFLFSGPKTASAIARQTRLTPAAITAMVDRLERRGFVTRSADPTDRRKVLVASGEAAQTLAREIYGPVAEAGTGMLSRYSEAELRAVARFATDGVKVQEWMTEDLLSRRGKAWAEAPPIVSAAQPIRRHLSSLWNDGAVEGGGGQPRTRLLARAAKAPHPPSRCRYAPPAGRPLPQRER